MPATRLARRPTSRSHQLSPLLLLLILLVPIPGCTDGEPLLFTDEVELSEIRIEPQEAVMSRDGEIGFTAVLIDLDGNQVPAGPNAPTITWNTASPNIAQIDGQGRAQATGTGFTRVTAVAGDILAEAVVIVQPQLQGIGFDRAELEFEGVAGLPLDEDVAIRVEDATGAGVSGVTVRFAPRPGSGSVSAGLAVTDASGTARTSWTLGRRAGLHRVDASFPRPDDGPMAAQTDDPGVAAAPPDRNPHGKLVGRARPGSPKEVVVSPSSATSEVGDSLQFEAEVRDQHGNVIPDAQVTWTSSEVEVATVDEDDGVADAHSEGAAVIQAEVEGTSGSGSLTVGDGDGTEPGAVESLTIQPSNWTLAGIGDTVRLDAVARDAEGRTVPDAEVEWSSKDPEIATVSSEGLVTSRDIGSVAIIATLLCTTSGCEEITAASDGDIEEVDEITDPGQVSDLRVVESTTGSITVAFTEVDDGAGDPASYALRYGSPTISWGSAASTEVVLDGSSIGSTREYEYNGLDPDTDYQFQVVAFRGTLNAEATFGELSNVASGATVAVEAGEPQSIVITPSSVVLRGTGRTAQLTAEAKDADGNTVPDASFEWSSLDPNIASVSSEGLVESNSLGITMVVAALMCGTQACDDGLTEPAEVQVTEPSAMHPNEPAGYEPWFEHDWSWFETVRDNMPREATGTGWFTTAGWSGGRYPEELTNYEYVSDANGEHGYGGYVRATIPEGHEGGSDLGGFSMMSANALPSTDGPHIDLKKAYMSFWLYFESHPTAGDFDSNRFLRMVSINRHDRGHSCNGTADMLWGPRNPVTQLFTGNWPEYRLIIYPDCPNDPPNNLHQWGPGLSLDRWQQVEILWERTSGSMTVEDPEGESKVTVWVDGEVEYEFEGPHRMNNAFRQFFLNNNPTGGSWASSGTNLKGRDDHFRFTGFYVSGVPVDE